MALKLYNSLTRRKEEFKPLKKGHVGIYVCGPTVYGHAHLGHAKSYVSFDCLVRYLRYLGYNVTYVQNITDVGHLTDDADQGEDKIAKAAAKEKKHPRAIADFYTKSYFEDMDALNCVRPDMSPRASGEIPEQIELVETLIKKGYAYEVNGSVYFDVSKFKDYGKLSGRNIEEMQAGARVEVSPDKKHPADFALWKRAEPNHIMQWKSPWGRGYPGWHLECSVMAMKYLGNTIDIHGGGLENQFPHHECEIAQSEAANGVQFVRYWVHHNMVTVDGQKMGKSLNNFITLKQTFSNSPELKHDRLSRKYDPLAVRFLILNTHYRSPIDFSDEALLSAQTGYEKLRETVLRLRMAWNSAPEGALDQGVERELKSIEGEFKDAMDNDLNTPIALSVISKLVRFSNILVEAETASKATLDAVDKLFRKLGGGEDVKDEKGCLGIVKGAYLDIHAGDVLFPKSVAILIELRNEAKKNKNFSEADAIRNKLDGMGVLIEDLPDGKTRWRMK
jgi:cysteinyl-tRNA synthetase